MNKAELVALRNKYWQDKEDKVLKSKGSEIIKIIDMVRKKCEKEARTGGCEITIDWGYCLDYVSQKIIEILEKEDKLEVTYNGGGYYKIVWAEV